MKMNYRIAWIAGFLGIFFMLAGQLHAQFTWGIQDISIAATNTQYGLPLMKIDPIHPGIELEATFLSKEGERTGHRFSANSGYFYHSVLVHSIYVQSRYMFQIRIKDFIGIDLAAGAGYAHLIYPGEGYKYDEATGRFKSGSYHGDRFLASAGVGFSYTRPPTFHPFIRYDAMMLGNIYNLTAALKLGLRINL